MKALPTAKLRVMVLLAAAAYEAEEGNVEPNWLNCAIHEAAAPMKRIKSWFGGRRGELVELAGQAAIASYSAAVDSPTPELAVMKAIPELVAVGIGYVGQEKLRRNVNELAQELRRLHVDVDRSPELMLTGLRAAATIADQDKRKRLAFALANLCRPVVDVTDDSDPSPRAENEEVLAAACLRAVTELATVEIEILGVVESLYRVSDPLVRGGTVTGDQLWDILVKRRPHISREAFLAGIRHVISLGLLDEPDVYGGPVLQASQLTFRFLASIREPAADSLSEPKAR